MNKAAIKRTIPILQVLKKTHPNAKIVLNYKSTWELLVAVVLSAQCTDKMVNRVTSKLFKKYTTLDSYVNAVPTEFEMDIKSTGFFRNKAKNILASAKIIKNKYNGIVPDNMEDLLTLPGVARKTANIILGNAYGIIKGIAVDTHVLRISQRLRLVDLKTIGGKKKVILRDNKTIDYLKDAISEKVESQLMTITPKSEWFHFTYRIIDHGRSLCKAINPLCSLCPLKTLCPVARF